MADLKTNANMCFQRILIGYDGSKEAEKALKLGLSIAKSLHSKVEILAVAHPPQPSTSVEVHAVLDEARERYERELKRVAKVANKIGIQVATDVAVGHPAEQIIKRAEESRADLIVVGHRGLSKLKQLVLGSVSERVLSYAPCPVLVTR